MSLGVFLIPWGVPRLDLVDECGRRRATAPQTLTTQMAECALRHVAPTAVFGGIMDRELIRASCRRRRITCFIQRGFGMGMPMVHHQTKFAHLRIMLLNKCWDKVGPLNWGPLRSDVGVPLSRSWFKSPKNMCRPIALILGVISPRLSRLSLERSMDCTHQLG
jgi:hypothetical protein